jgi:hypothetical protein
MTISTGCCHDAARQITSVGTVPSYLGEMGEPTGRSSMTEFDIEDRPGGSYES